MNELLQNINKLHTTELGVQRIKRKLNLDVVDVVAWCRQRIQDASCSIERKGKNWYASVDYCRITVNAYSYTIITARKVKKEKQL